MAKKLRTEIRKATKTTDNIWWYEKGNRSWEGFGYIIKDTGFICIIRCPQCCNENYALNITTGTCSSCGWDANELQKAKRDLANSVQCQMVCGNGGGVPTDKHVLGCPQYSSGHSISADGSCNMGCC